MKVAIIVLCICIGMNFSFFVCNSQTIDNIIKEDRYNDLFLNGDTLSVLKDLICYGEEEVSFLDVWYSNSRIDTLIYTKSYLSRDTLFVSYKIKSIFWLWTLYYEHDIMEGDIGVLINVNTNRVVYDFKSHNLNQFQKIEPNEMDEINLMLKDWYEIIIVLGMNYARQNNVDILGGKYSFKVITK